MSLILGLFRASPEFASNISEGQFTTGSSTAVVDGMTLTMEVAPYVKDGRIFIPLDYAVQALGLSNEQVFWDEARQTISLRNSYNWVQAQIGSTTIVVGGSPAFIDGAPEIVNGCICLPIAPIAQAFGYAASWNDSTKTVTIKPKALHVSSSDASSDNTKVHFIDVGQGDSIYIQLPNHIDILIDGGNVYDGRTVVNYLKAQGVDDIDLLIATHPHDDHMGGLPAVLETFKVKEIIDSGKTDDYSFYQKFSTDALAEDCLWEQNNKQVFTWNNVTLQILTGQGSWVNTNDYSVVARLDVGNIKFLFEGDAETPGEEALQGDISADILKVGHHGGDSSTSSNFLSHVNPKMAVISVGAGNTYGLPVQSILDRLSAAGAKIYRTDLNGTVVVITDGKTYKVSTEH